jgi:hypothetical protein
MTKPNFGSLPTTGVALPEAVQAVARANIDQIKNTRQQAIAFAEQFNGALAKSGVAWFNQSATVNAKLIEATIANSDAFLDYTRELVGVDSFKAGAELSTQHLQKQAAAWMEQAQSIAASGYKAAVENVESLQAHTTSVTKQAA